MSEIRNRVHWLLLWLAYRAVLLLPMSLGNHKFFLWWWLLPYAGQFAHTADFTEFRRLNEEPTP